MVLLIFHNINMQLASLYPQIFVAQNIIPQKSHEKGRGEAGEMASLRSLATPKPSSAVRSTPPVVFAGRRKWAESRRRTSGVVASRLGADGSDPLLQAALRAASLRFQESLRPGPRFPPTLSISYCFNDRNVFDEIR